MDALKKKTITTKRFEYTDTENPGSLVIILVAIMTVLAIMWNTLAPTNFLERVISVGMLVATYYLIGRYQVRTRQEITTVEEREKNGNQNSKC